MSKEKPVPLTSERGRIIAHRIHSILSRLESTAQPLQGDIYQALESVAEAAQGMLERGTRDRPRLPYYERRTR